MQTTYADAAPSAAALTLAQRAQERLLQSAKAAEFGFSVTAHPFHAGALCAYNDALLVLADQFRGELDSAAVAAHVHRGRQAIAAAKLDVPDVVECTADFLAKLGPPRSEQIGDGVFAALLDDRYQRAASADHRDSSSGHAQGSAIEGGAQ